MRHVIAGTVLFAIAVAVTMAVATMLQSMATSRAPQTVDYTPPALTGPSGKVKAGETGRSLMVSRRMNDENSERSSETNNE